MESQYGISEIRNEREMTAIEPRVECPDRDGGTPE